MKYIEEFRDGDLARNLASAIAAEAEPGRPYRFMEFCGGHTHAIARYGIEDLLPKEVRMIHGPGCPVCVLPASAVDNAIMLAGKPDVILCTYADMMRVPGSGRKTLLAAKAEGGDLRMVYSTLDALQAAVDNPQRQVVFFAIGFETTTPPTAFAILEAKRRGLDNFSVFCNHVLTPAAMRAIMDDPEGLALDGFVGPAHVSTVIGVRAYEPFAGDGGKPVVIAGFEPLDVLQAILMLIRQVNEGRSEVENEYSRAVGHDGNAKAQEIINEVFEVRPEFEWRGLGMTPNSALAIRAEYAEWDAERRFAVVTAPGVDHKACQCGAILRGRKRPADCRLFGAACTPESPMGACMVSAEGACAAYWTYGRFRGAKDAL
ncbi:MAG: hydrogenase formation protein HypD [Rhodospirillales bacterium RIFCSPLOWO2_12_FULL_58_28]|nr:MAG: hydrogenase formation protein HypD [Rhodospirillales bacterium RIFCSPLOWO2_02_FULL_58_16]OHC79826.1 MAG: hydrogenase formation protein HypD [Rhodospirillales bacterium RIFCSPLOWO2_12_FULL_58_28]